MLDNIDGKTLLKITREFRKMLKELKLILWFAVALAGTVFILPIVTDFYLENKKLNATLLVAQQSYSPASIHKGHEKPEPSHSKTE